MRTRRNVGLAALAAAVLLAGTACSDDNRTAEGVDQQPSQLEGGGDQEQSSDQPAATTVDTVISDLLDDIRAATARFHDVAEAEAAGYATDGGCVPMMGYHYVNGIHESADIDPLEPNILVYAPDAHGDLQLVAVEYGTFAEGAELFGVGFDPPGDPGPPFSTLHAWVWLGNPDGTFAAHNPLVSCD